jgi:signal transduction histidine kinase
LVQLRTQRTALILYGVLLVLPTIVLGGLQWRQIERDFELDSSTIPQKARGAADRFRDMVADRLNALLDREALRPFTDYGDQVIASDASLTDTTPLTSPLMRQKVQPQVQAWFAFDLRERLEAKIDLWGGASTSEAELDAKFQQPLKELLARYVEDIGASRLMWRWDPPSMMDVSLLQVAFNRLQKRDQDCLQYQPSALAQRKVTLQVTPFHVQFFLDSTATPRLVATRRVWLGPTQELNQFGGDCYSGLAQGMALVQGFLIDTNWFFRDLPADVAKGVLDSSQRFVAWGGPPCCGGNEEFHEEIRLLEDLTAIETSDHSELAFAPMRIAVDTAAIDSKFQSKRMGFFVLAAMLVISLATGMWLLLRSVQRDLEQAARTENFVAAVTHELRTPLTSIKMYGEMLLDGDATDSGKQREYYKRIVRATERLGTLVERVLEKSRLSAGGARPEAGDLNHLVSGLERQLAQYGPEGDLRFELDPSIPDVLLTQEAVISIVSNLVENARKYAAVDMTRPGAEPIVVRTSQQRGEVSLEVLDRGPGVPEAERGKIFEAFYRVGNEATRTARGAGLGLHLVLLQARSIGGDAGCLPREGGGSVFWVQFAPATAPA